MHLNYFVQINSTDGGAFGLPMLTEYLLCAHSKLGAKDLTTISGCGCHLGFRLAGEETGRQATTVPHVTHKDDPRKHLEKGCLD